MAVSASPHLTRQGVSGVPDAAPLRQKFATSGRLILPGLASTDVVEWLSRCRSKGSWLTLPENPGIELLEDPDGWDEMNSLVGSRNFLDVVRRITAGATLAGFRGDTFRLLPGPGRSSMTRHLRATCGSALGLLVNLDRSPLSLEFPCDPDIWNRQPRLHSGDALLYRYLSAPDFPSPVVASEGPNTIFHGWFEERDAFPGEIQRRE